MSSSSSSSSNSSRNKMVGGLALGVLVLTAVFGSVSSEGSGYPGNGPHGSGYPGGSGYAGASGYGGGSGYPGGSGYSGGSGYPGGSGGYGGGGYFPAFMPAPVYNRRADRKLTEVDKLFSRLADLASDFHTAKEQLDSIRAQLGVMTRLKDKFILQKEALTDQDNENLDALATFSGAMANAESLLNEINNTLTATDPINDANTDNLMAEGARLAMGFADDAEQAGRIADLAAQIPILKDRLSSMTKNAFDCMCNFIEVERGLSQGLGDLALGQRCETGTVTIHRDDRRGTALFQTSFGEQIPYVMYGLVGYSFNLNVREDSGHHRPYGGFGYGGGYGNHGYESPEPNAMGVLVTAIPSPDGITFDVNNLSFGDSAPKFVKVNYQACNIMNSDL